MSFSNFDSQWKLMQNFNIELENEINKEFTCMICKRLLINSHSGPCGCRFCFKCINGYLNENIGEEETGRFCPSNLNDCQNVYLNISTNIYYDQSVDIRLSKTIVKCPEKSCDFKGELRKMEDHIRVCNFQSVKCPYYSVGCKEIKMDSEKIENHLLTENYSHSKLLLEFIHNLQNEVESLKNEVIELRKENSYLKVELKETQTNAKINHMTITELQNNIEKLFVNETKKSENDQLIKGIEESYVEQISEFEQIKEKYFEVESKLEKIDQQTLVKPCDCKMKISEILKKNNFNLFTKFNENELSIKYLERKIINIEKKQELQNYGEFIWNIKKFTEKRREAPTDVSKATIFSDSFYSHRNGYRVSIGISPDGVGIAQHTHLSVWFRIMKGFYDNSLSWPFNYNVTLSIINQNTGLRHVSHTLTYEAYAKNTGCNKPMKENSNPIGIYKLIKIDQLLNDSFIFQNDEIFVQCKIHVPL